MGPVEAKSGPSCVKHTIVFNSLFQKNEMFQIGREVFGLPPLSPLNKSDIQGPPKFIESNFSLTL